MLRSMARRRLYSRWRAGKDVIIPTGRSDFPNQVNNILGFRFTFRGELEVPATAIYEEMKLATRALAALAREDELDGVDRIRFYRRLHHPEAVRSAGAGVKGFHGGEAAMETGVARTPVDLEEYRKRLERRKGCWGRRTK
jgi:malate dehydrogenase (oxaloacetate-decarboxylating)(NADP+)